MAQQVEDDIWTVINSFGYYFLIPLCDERNRKKYVNNNNKTVILAASKQ